MQRLVLATVIVLCGCSAPKSATEAAQAYDVQISNGFSGRGGVIIGPTHVLGHVGSVPASGEAQIMVAGKAYQLGMVRRDDSGFGLLLVQGKIEPAPLGDSGALDSGAELTFASFDDAGKITVNKALVSGWRAHQGRVYIEIDATLAKGTEGSGVFGPDGRLIGLVEFTLGNSLTYVLPIEYLTSGANPLTAAALPQQKASEAFVKRRNDAESHKQALQRPLSWQHLQVEQSYSRTALVGRILMLNKPGADAAKATSLSYKLEGINEKRARRTLARGTLPGSEQRWVPQNEQKNTLAAATSAQFGSSYVEKNIAPYDYGELRYRLPFSLFCGKVDETEVHALTLSLADGRQAEEIGFVDLVNICAAIEDADGVALEKQWGFGQTPAKATVKPKAGKKRKR